MNIRNGDSHVYLLIGYGKQILVEEARFVQIKYNQSAINLVEQEFSLRWRWFVYLFPLKSPPTTPVDGS